MATLYCARCMTTFDHAAGACPNERCAAPPPDAGWAAILGPGDHLDRHYVIERCLAVGSAGLTYLARETLPDGSPTGPRLAVKVLYASRAAGPFLRRLSMEAQILQELSHDHIVQLRGFVHRAGTEPYLVTLFEEGGSLAEHVARVGPLAPSVAVAIVHQVLLALDVAHQAGVVHRDLKPDNVLLSSTVPADQVPHVRVGDFGIATVDHGVASRQPEVPAFAGTPEYAAPEQFEGTDPGPATDVFAAGGLLVYLLTAAPPVSLSERTNLPLVLQELTSKLPPRLSKVGARGSETELAALQPVVSQMMARQPSARWTVPDALHALGAFVGADPDPAAGLADGPPLPPDISEAGLAPRDLATDGPPRPPPSIVNEPLPGPITPLDAPSASERPSLAPAPSPARPQPSTTERPRQPGLSPAPPPDPRTLESMADAPDPPFRAHEEAAPVVPLAQRLAAERPAPASKVVGVTATLASTPLPEAPRMPLPRSAAVAHDTPSLTVPRPSAQIAPPREVSRSRRSRTGRWALVVAALLISVVAAGAAWWWLPL